MTLAEALMERAALKNKISDLKSRIEDNILIQEDSKPTEDPKVLIAELNSAIDRFEHLIKSINKTNACTLIDGESITDLIARRDALNLKYNTYDSFADTARNSTSRVRGSEIRIVNAIDYDIFQKTMDDTAKALRLLDVRLQKANWTSELIED